MKQHFIGFADSGKFLAAVDRTRPINLSITRKNGRPDRRFGIAVNSTVLTLSQVCENEVLYFSSIVHRYQTVAGGIMDIDEGKPRRLAEQVDQIARQYLTEQGITWREAMLSMPINYTVMNGIATFLKWNDVSQSYLYQKEEAAQAEQ